MVLSKGKIIAGVAAVAVLIVGGIAFAALNGGSGAKGAEVAGGAPGKPAGPGGPGGPGGGRGMVTQVEAVAAASRVFSSRIEALGTLEPRERVVLSANAADRVTGVFFEDGQRVAKGKVLMTLVNEEENAALEAARATEANTRLVYERNKRLAAADAVAQPQVDQDVDFVPAHMRHHRVGTMRDLDARF